MIIDNLDQMHAIVQDSKTLKWDGWSVLSLVEDDFAEYLPSGSYDRTTGKWYKKTVFHCTEKGWDIPESVM